MNTELVWAAGFYDGEGSTYCTVDKGGYPRLFIDIAQTDSRPLHRFISAVDEGTVTGPYPGKGNRQDFYKLRASGARVYTILQRMWPHLSDPKKEQAIDVITKYEKIKY